MSRLNPLVVFMIFIFIMILTVILLLPIMLFVVLAAEGMENMISIILSPLFLVIMLLIQAIIFILVPYLFYFRPGILTFKEIGLDTRSMGSRIVVGLMAGLIMGGVVTALIMLLQTETSGGLPSLEGLNLTNYLLLLLGSSVLAPLGEEFFFRGIAFRGVRKYLEQRGSSNAAVWAAIFSSIIFAGAHGYDIFGSVVVLVGGLVFALLFQKTGSIIPPMIAHGTYNGVIVTLDFLQIS